MCAVGQKVAARMLTHKCDPWYDIILMWNRPRNKNNELLLKTQAIKRGTSPKINMQTPAGFRVNDEFFSRLCIDLKRKPQISVSKCKASLWLTETALPQRLRRKYLSPLEAAPLAPRQAAFTNRLRFVVTPLPVTGALRTSLQSKLHEALAGHAAFISRPWLFQMFCRTCKGGP